MKSCLVSCRNRIIFDHCSEENYWTFEWFSESSESIPRNQPTVSRPSRIATILLMFLFLFFVQLVPQFRSSQIDEVSKFGDSTIIIHRICQILMNCQCKFLLAFVTVRETFVNSFPSPEKFLLGTEKTESMEWQDLTPRSVSVIVPRFTFLGEDFVICCYQVPKLFCSWNRCFASGPSARVPCNFGPQAYIAISVFWEVSFNAVLP